MPNFFEQRRTKLRLNRTELAARIGKSAEIVRLWEKERLYPRVPIATLATAYEISEDKAADEVMALRRRIEAKKEMADAS